MKKEIVCTLLFLSVTLGYVSCSKSDAVASRPCLLTKAIDSLFNNGILTVTYLDEFTYDSKNKLTKVTSSAINNATTSIVYYNYFYTNDMVSSMTYEDPKNTANNYTATWTNENGHVTKIASSKFTTTFIYDVTGNLTNTALDAGAFNASYARTFDSNKEMNDSHLVETWTGGGLTFNVSYSAYDTNFNPFMLVATAMGQPYYFPKGEGFADDRFLFKNNPTKESGDNVWDFSYQYNSKNYPTKATWTPSLSSGTIVKRTFEYANCN